MRPTQRSTLFPYTTLFRSAARLWCEKMSATKYGQWRYVFAPQRKLEAELAARSEEHTSELQLQFHLVCRLLLEKKKKTLPTPSTPHRTPTSTTHPYLPIPN